MACLRDSWRTSLPASRPHRNPSRVLRPESSLDALDRLRSDLWVRLPLRLAGHAHGGIDHAEVEVAAKPLVAPALHGLEEKAALERIRISVQELALLITIVEQAEPLQVGEQGL